MSDFDRISVTSLYGFHSGEALVQITMGTEQAQLPVGDAIQVARHILEAANAASTDWLLVRFLTEKLDQPMEVATAVLRDMRKWRKALE